MEALILKEQVTVESSLFMAFVDNPCPQNYILMNVYTSICLIFIKINPNLQPTKLHPHEPGKIWLPTNIGPHK